MGKTFVVNSLEDMCNLMCDNNTKGIEMYNRFADKDYTVGELTEGLIYIRDKYKGDMTREESDMLADACNILDRELDIDKSVGDILYGEE